MATFSSRETQKLPLLNLYVTFVINSLPLLV